MAGLDPAIQGPTFERLFMLHWMAASEGGHGVVDEAQPPRTLIVPRADARLDPGLRRDDGAHKLTLPCDYR